MEEHTSCSCYDCDPNIPECPSGFEIGPNCTCQCAHKSDRHNCQVAYVMELLKKSGNRKGNVTYLLDFSEFIGWKPHREENDGCNFKVIENGTRTSAVAYTNIRTTTYSSPAVDLSSLPKLKAAITHQNH
ncbi:hypothetical protein TELCIR_17013 [Teladorsagia circumcincta]|uniref:Uncharacterized protein n=1 Tax=Teladorsagia circumcincta TaxID=45464 RepID=A0A2G9TU07_TELCI|nr:hypothetical protein TELCIR_17013 [Teladorsagia circumcincta]